ncbi:MAG TPA: hypothetical protein PLX89_14230 [Verrucomicrobiota bacterium]|nr:hypothetical protein [Verrucomicrobiota bacterium]
MKSLRLANAFLPALPMNRWPNSPARSSGFWSRAISILPISVNYPPHQYPGLIVLELPDDATARQVNQTVTTFLARSDWVAQLPGRLAIVGSWRVRFRSA